MVPPSRLGIALAVEAGCMMVATQRMTDKYRVTSVLIELAIGFNHQVETRECLPAPQGQGLVKMDAFWGYEPDRVCFEFFRHDQDSRAGAGFVTVVCRTNWVKCQ